MSTNLASQKILKRILHTEEKKKIVTNMIVQKRIKFKKGMDEHRKLSTMPNSANQQNLKMNNGEKRTNNTRIKHQN
jgi:hypothetical protein